MKHLSLIAAAVATLAAGPVFANSFASASLGPIRVTLFDMDVLDGVDPSISFGTTGDANDTAAHVFLYRSSPEDQHEQYTNGAVQWAPVSASVNTSWGGASASLVGASTLLSPNGMTLSASGSVNNPISVGYFSYDYAYFVAGVEAPSSKTGFTLSANTAVMFSALSETTVSLSGPRTGSDDAHAATTMGISGLGALGSGSQTASDDNYSDVDWNSSYLKASQSRRLGVSFLNLTNESMDGVFNTSVSASGGVYNIAAVPEPESYAMLLTGLGLMGAVARRRSKKS